MNLRPLDDARVSPWAIKKTLACQILLIGKHIREVMMNKTSTTLDVIDPWLTVSEAAALIGIGKSTFRRGVSQGRFPLPVKVGGLTRWPRSELIGALEELKSRRPSAVGQK